MFLHFCARIVIFRIISLRGGLTPSLSLWLTKLFPRTDFADRRLCHFSLFVQLSVELWKYISRRQHPIWTKRCLKLNLFFSWTWVAIFFSSLFKSTIDHQRKRFLSFLCSSHSIGFWVSFIFFQSHKAKTADAVWIPGLRCSKIRK